MPPNIKNKFKELKQKTLELALFPVGFVSYHFFGKGLVFNRFNVKRPPDYFCQEIAKNIEISSESTEFSLRPPVKVRKTRSVIQIFIEGYDRHYFNYLTKPDEFKNTDFFHKPVLPDGTIINPTVQLIDENEKTHDLKFVWRAYCLGFTGNLPRDTEYVRLKVSADISFKASLIRWFDWEPENER